MTDTPVEEMSNPLDFSLQKEMHLLLVSLQERREIGAKAKPGVDTHDSFVEFSPSLTMAVCDEVNLLQR